MTAASGPPNPLDALSHRPFPLRGGPWSMRQTWNDLLFAHWPIPPASMAALLPPGLELDTFDGQAWAGVVPFWMDQVGERLLGPRVLHIPTATLFSELNLRTYVRSSRTGRPGVYFFSLDCSSPLAVLGARMLFHLPYFFASMRRSRQSGLIDYHSRRLGLSSTPSFEASFRPIGPPAPAPPGSLPDFLTARFCLYTPHRGRILVGHIHHAPWPLQPAEAEIRRNEIPLVHGIVLPATAPLLHFSRRLEVLIWPLLPDL